MTGKRVLAFLLGLLVLFLQQGMVLHELGHAFEEIEHRHEHSGGGHLDTCELCAALAPCHSALPPSTVVTPPGPERFVQVPNRSPADFRPVEAAPYRSHAPPLPLPTIPA